MKPMIEKMTVMMRAEDIDEETTRIAERLVVLRLLTKHINLWMRQLEMKRGR